MNNVYVVTGGTMVHVTPHFSLCAPAYGQVGSLIFDRLQRGVRASARLYGCNVYLINTRMAGTNSTRTVDHLTEYGMTHPVETNDDLEALVRQLCSRPETAAIVMAAAVCDFQPLALTGFEGDGTVDIHRFGKDQKRLHNTGSLNLKIGPGNKIIDVIKNARPDVVLATFKTTAGASEDELISKSFRNLKRSKSDLVFGNDIHSKSNVVVTSSENVLRGVDRLETLEIFCTELLNRLAFD